MLQINYDPQADAIYIRLHEGEVDNRCRLASTFMPMSMRMGFHWGRDSVCQLGHGQQSANRRVVQR